jgi:exosome complex component RRP46
MAAMINASTLALLNAGSMNMHGIVCAVPVALLSSGRLLVDPEEEEEIEDAQIGGCFAFMFKDSKSQPECVFSRWQKTGRKGTGSVENSLEEAMALARVAAKAIWKNAKASVDLGSSENHDEDASESESEDDDKMEI